MPIGRRCSSASWPSSPAVRASRAKPRSRSTGRPRSARAAPHTPAPLSGSLRPRTWSCTRPMALNSRRCGPYRPSSSAIRIRAGVRGSPALCTGWPSPGTKRPAALVVRTDSRARASQPASSLGRSSCASSTSCRYWPQSSVTPRKRDPPPSSPAASAPCRESGADSKVSRAAMAVGVKPWSARATSTASNTRTSPGVGRRRVTSQNASSPKPTWPIRSAATSWPSSRMWSASEVPSDVGNSGRSQSSVRSSSAPSSQARISAPCSSSPGGGSRYSAALSEKVIGLRTLGTACALGPTSTTGSRPISVAKATPASMVLIGPHGTPAAMISRNHSCLVRVRQPLDQQRPELVPVGGPVLVAGEPRVVDQLGQAQDRAELRELAVVAGGDDQVAVGAGQRLVREQAGVAVAHPEGHRAAGDVRAGVVDQAGQRGGEQVDLDVLAAAGLVPLVQRGQHADGGVQPGHHVEHRDARPVAPGRPGPRSGSSARRWPARSGRSRAARRPSRRCRSR